MKKTIEILNELKEKKIIQDYAIGGGIAALFYIEPFLTYDLDVFITTIEEKKGGIISLSNLYSYLNSKGYKFEGEHIIIEEIPVQFIVCDSLEKEALENSILKKYEGIPIKIFSAEYLIAILLRSGRKKDIEKVEKIFENTKINKKKLKEILKKHKIKTLWKI